MAGGRQVGGEHPFRSKSDPGHARRSLRGKTKGKREKKDVKENAKKKETKHQKGQDKKDARDNQDKSNPDENQDTPPTMENRVQLKDHMCADACMECSLGKLQRRERDAQSETCAMSPSTIGTR